MRSLRLFLISVTLLPSLWAEQDTGSLEVDKRFSINMMDPFTRRSALDKNFVRFGRSGGGIRENRARPDSFVRFGRSNEDGEGDDDDDEIENGDILSERETRGKTDFIRFGRGGTSSGFIRFGKRGKNDNFVRFGRARPDSFVRFGKSSGNYKYNREPYIEDIGNNLNRIIRGGGKSSLNTNFVRYGKRVPETDEEVINAYKNGINLDSDQLRKDNLERTARYSMRTKGDSFIRFGRATSGQTYDGDLSVKLAAALKEMKSNQKLNNPADDQIYQENSNSDTELPDSTKASPRNTKSSETFTNFDRSIQNDMITRKKRSISLSHKPKSNRSALLISTDSPDIIPVYNYPTSLAAGLPNFIIGPELSVLPTQQKLITGKKSDERNFIRLG